MTRCTAEWLPLNPAHQKRNPAPKSIAARTLYRKRNVQSAIKAKVSLSMNCHLPFRRAYLFLGRCRHRIVFRARPTPAAGDEHGQRMRAEIRSQYRDGQHRNQYEEAQQAIEEPAHVG